MDLAEALCVAERAMKQSQNKAGEDVRKWGSTEFGASHREWFEDLREAREVIGNTDFTPLSRNHT